MIQDTSLDAYKETDVEREFMRDRIYDLVCCIVTP